MIFKMGFMDEKNEYNNVKLFLPTQTTKGSLYSLTPVLI